MKTNEEKLAKVNAQIAEIEKAEKDEHLAEGTAEVYSRVSGYYRNVALFNDGKKVEECSRKQYDIEKSA